MRPVKAKLAHPSTSVYHLASLRAVMVPLSHCRHELQQQQQVRALVLR